MDNKITPEVIERFLNNQCDEQEAEQVTNYLKNVSPEELNQYLNDNEWQNQHIPIDQHLPDEIRDQMWVDLTKKTALYKTPSVVYLKRFLAAACVISVLLTGYYFYTAKTNGATEYSKQGETAKIKISKQNTTEEDQNLLLPDGTNMILKPGASLYYYSSFKDNREIFLTGIAYFSVIHDVAHPFVVKTNGISITDLGTKFWVENKEAAQTVTIKLIEGLVLIQSVEETFGMKDVHLKPGQKVIIHKLSGEVSVSDIKEPSTANASQRVDKVASAGKTTWTNAAYTFSKTSLGEVFNKLATRYKVIFIVEDQEIYKRQFTGKVMYTDSLEPLMNVICAINNLSYTKHGDTLYLKN